MEDRRKGALEWRMSKVDRRVHAYDPDHIDKGPLCCSALRSKDDDGNANPCPTCVDLAEVFIEFFEGSSGKEGIGGADSKTIFSEAGAARRFLARAESWIGGPLGGRGRDEAEKGGEE